MTRYFAESLGSAFLLISVVGSGIMGAELSQGNDAIALLANAIATGAALFVLIAIFGPISGAHFNPIVTAYFALRGEMHMREAACYIIAQVLGAILGVFATHLMFDDTIFQLSENTRAGFGQFTSEIIASFGLLMTIVLGARFRPKDIPALVGFYITGAYWFTASTSFANPSVTIARTLTDSFAGIAYQNAPLFICAQIVGLGVAVLVLPKFVTAAETLPKE